MPASSAKRRVFAREPPRDQLVLKKQKHSNPITLFLKDRLIRQIKVLWQSSKQTANKLYKVLSIKFYLRSKAKVLVMCGVRVKMELTRNSKTRTVKYGVFFQSVIPCKKVQLAQWTFALKFNTTSSLLTTIQITHTEVVVWVIKIHSRVVCFNCDKTKSFTTPVLQSWLEIFQISTLSKNFLKKLMPSLLTLTIFSIFHVT